MACVEIDAEENWAVARSCDLQGSDELGDDPGWNARIVYAGDAHDGGVFCAGHNVIVSADRVKRGVLVLHGDVAKFRNVRGAALRSLKVQRIGDADIVDSCSEQFWTLGDGAA